ncbi:TPA: type III-B CRISPR module RAMP protein Cmr6 [Streptococcus suis]
MNEREMQSWVPEAFELLKAYAVESRYSLFTVQLASFAAAIAMGNIDMAKRHFAAGLTKDKPVVKKVYTVRRDILIVWDDLVNKMKEKEQPSKREYLLAIEALRIALLYYAPGSEDKTEPAQAKGFLPKQLLESIGQGKKATESGNLSYRFYAGNMDTSREILGNIDRKVDYPYQELLDLCLQQKAVDGIYYDAQTGFGSFSLEVTYPGLTTGLGILYENASEGGIKSGFSLDYNTGLPFIQGSNVKGRLRSIMEKLAQVEPPSEELPAPIQQESLASYLRKFQQDSGSLEPMKLVTAIFAGQEDWEMGDDIFFDAFADRPDCLAEDFVTKHHQHNFLEPVPVRFLRIKPDTKITFLFKVSDFVDGETSLSALTKLKLFRSLLMEYGIGAKTNKGYGYLK